MPALYRLNARKVASLMSPGHHGDGGGLYLHVDGRSEGRPPSRRWEFVYHYGMTASGKSARRLMSLGSLATMSLAEAREEASRLREIVASGKDPKAERDGERQALAAAPAKPTFQEEADATLEALREQWRGKKTEPRWKLAIAYAAPFASKPVEEVTTDDVLAVLKPMWRTKPEMAQKVRVTWERVFTAARTRANARVKGSWTADNPARWTDHLQHLLSKPVKLSRGRHAALEPEAMPAFTAKLREREGRAALALQWTALTGVRTSTTLEATWGEMDLAGGLWTIPVGRLKNAEDLAKAGFKVFQVPLAEPCKTVLRALLAERLDGSLPQPGDLVFPSPKGDGPLSSNAMRALLIRMGYTDEAKITVHGFRTTLRVWGGRQTAETKVGSEVSRFSNETLEFSIGHVVGSAVQRAYDRSDYLAQRTRLMAAWAEYAMGEAASPGL